MHFSRDIAHIKYLKIAIKCVISLSPCDIMWCGSLRSGENYLQIPLRFIDTELRYRGNVTPATELQVTLCEETRNTLRTRSRNSQNSSGS
jgi:hypothetical protein